jgi:hypothetical protein
MVVLWWLVPPLVATVLAMLWAGWVGRERDEVKRDDSPEAMERMRRALEKPIPRRGKPVVSRPLEPSHGVALRGRSRRPASDAPTSR